MREKRDEILILRITKIEKNRIYEKMYGMGIRSLSAYISELSESTREDAGADEGAEKRRNVFCRQQERTGTAADPIKRKSPRIRSQSVLGKNPRWLF